MTATEVKPLTPADLEDLRGRVLRGETLSTDQYQQVVSSIRALRGRAIASSSSAAASTASVKKAQQAAMPVTDLLKDLGL